jgi:hypothetical protein
VSALDPVTLSASTFKASRTLSRDRVASFLREPFVEGSHELTPARGFSTRSAGFAARRAKANELEEEAS